MGERDNRKNRKETIAFDYQTAYNFFFKDKTKFSLFNTEEAATKNLGRIFE